MTEDEKVEQLAKAFCAKLDNITTMAQWENLIDNVNKQMVVNFLQNKLTIEKDKGVTNIAKWETFVEDMDDLITEVGNF